MNMSIYQSINQSINLSNQLINLSKEGGIKTRQPGKQGHIFMALPALH